MSIPQYSQRKDSGVTWLGQVPASWTLRRLGFYFDERREKVSDTDYPALSVTKGGVVAQLETAAKTDDGDNRKRVAVGDFVINSRSDRKGSAGISPFDGSVSLINTVLAPTQEVHPRFVHHLLRSTSFQEEYYRFGRGIVADLWSTNYGEMRNILLAVPSLREQAAIGAFLDREIAKIDGLVDEQKRLIELLKEKRHAVISQAVTKGLDPAVPMKDSGVEWLGPVPAHWGVVPIKHVARVGNGSTPNRDRLDYWEDGHFPWLSSSVVNQDLVTEPTALVTNVALAECHLPVVRPPAVVVGITGEGKTRGMASVLSIEATVNQHLAYVKPFASELPVEFIRRYFEMAYNQMRFESDGGGSTKGAITCSQLGNMRVPMPPHDEMLTIVEFLGKATSALAELQSEAEAAEVILIERRSALISAAVTGKIDVSKLVPTEPAVASA